MHVIDIKNIVAIFDGDGKCCGEPVQGVEEVLVQPQLPGASELAGFGITVDLLPIETFHEANDRGEWFMIELVDAMYP